MTLAAIPNNMRMQRKTRAIALITRQKVIGLCLNFLSDIM